MTLVAKPVVKNSVWIVVDNGKKIATIRRNQHGVEYIKGQARLEFASLKLLENEINVVFDKPVKRSSTHNKDDLPEFITHKKPYNVLYNLKYKCFVYTTSPKSKSYYCAGHFTIKVKNTWIEEFCPKLITLQRHQFQGPFKAKQEQELDKKFA
jgi:hypothetical protein